MKRREFFRSLGFGGTAAAISFISGSAFANSNVGGFSNQPKGIGEEVKKKLQGNHNKMTLCSIYGEPAPTPQQSAASPFSIVGQFNSLNYVPGTEKRVSVSLLPGPDGHLYVETNGSWKRILTEA